MDILYLLVPFSAVLVLGILGVFAWALQGGQFDDLEKEGREMLGRDPDPFDDHQASPPAVHEQ